MRPIQFVTLVAMVLATMPAFAADPVTKHKKPPAASAKPAVAPAPLVLPDPATPVAQALELGLTDCVPALSAMAHDTLTSNYDVQSGWHRGDPTHHVFQTIAGLNAPANTPPDSFVALIAAPVSAGGCDGVSVQVLPLAGTCDTAQEVIQKDGKSLGALLGTRLMLDSKGKRLILLPGAANTCIAITVESRFSAK
jgi:hypothetical protein